VLQCYVVTHPIPLGPVLEQACKLVASINSTRIDFLLRATVEADIVAEASGVQAMGHTARPTTLLPQSCPVNYLLAKNIDDNCAAFALGLRTEIQYKNKSKSKSKARKRKFPKKKYQKKRKRKLTSSEAMVSNHKLSCFVISQPECFTFCKPTSYRITSKKHAPSKIFDSVIRLTISSNSISIANPACRSIHLACSLRLSWSLYRLTRGYFK